MRPVLQAAAAILAVALVALVGLTGCGGSEACEKQGYGSQACAKHVQAEEEEACGPGGHFEGFLSCGNREADEKQEIREGWEKAEREAEFYGR
jgi:hypothetical protein